MKAATIGLTLALSVGGGAVAAEQAVVEQLAPTGKLRVGIAYAPATTPVFAAKDASGELHGVPRDLGVALAQALGVPFAIVPAPNTGDLTESVSAGAVDIGFMPVDDERRQRLDFSPPYFTIEST